MLKMALIVATTAGVSFAAGLWTVSTLGGYGANVASTAPIISPHEMHLKVKPNDLPVQYMQADAY